MIIQTLCLVFQSPRLLLGLKKRGFGQGRWNGFGGKVKVGEPLEAAAIRETQEEAGIIVSDITKRGVLFLDYLVARKFSLTLSQLMTLKKASIYSARRFWYFR